MTVEKFSLFGINLTFMSFHIVSIAERWASGGAKWPLRCSLRLVCFPQLSFKLVQNRFLVLCPSPNIGKCLLKRNRIMWSDTVSNWCISVCASSWLSPFTKLSACVYLSPENYALDLHFFLSPHALVWILIVRRKALNRMSDMSFQWILRQFHLNKFQSRAKQ